MRAARAKILATFTLFDNDHEECSQKLLQLLEVLRQHAIAFRLLELDPDEPVDEAALPAQHEITEEILRNILASHDAGLSKEQ